MTTYNIYSLDADVDTDDPSIVIELNDDDTQIVSATSVDSDTQTEVAAVIEGYQAAGLSATAIVARLAGSYGYFEAARPDSEAISAAAEDEMLVENAPAASPLEIDGTMAMTSDAGLVVTLLQKGEDGPEYRHGSEWVPVVDPSVFDGLTYVGVDDDSVTTYDKYETDGTVAPISEYTPSPDGPFWTDLIVNDDLVLDEETGIYGTALDGSEEDEEGSEVGSPEDDDSEEKEALTSSVILNSAEDLDAAIIAAVDDPDLQWYVQKRCEALGIEASLPWLRD